VISLPHIIKVTKIRKLISKSISNTVTIWNGKERKASQKVREHSPMDNGNATPGHGTAGQMTS